MVCPKCREQLHDDCRGGTWCDCQHKINNPIQIIMLASDSPSVSAPVVFMVDDDSVSLDGPKRARRVVAGRRAAGRPKP
jgi:hypothetical protein